MPAPSARAALLKPSATLATQAIVRRLRAEGRDVISLALGEPDFNTPDHIKQAGIAAIAGNRTRYTPGAGMPALREGVAARLLAAGHPACTAANVVITNGSKMLIYAAIVAVSEPGDEVIVPAPYWTSYPDIVRAAGAQPVVVPCPMEGGFKLTPDALRQALGPRTRALLLNSPNNPTGAVYSTAEIAALLKVVHARDDIFILSDEIYEHIRFDGERPLPVAAIDPTLADRVITISGFSKNEVMTGWRMGYATAALPIAQAMATLTGTIAGSPNAISQAAAIAALEGPRDFIAANTAVFARRRDIVVAGLAAIDGITCVSPNGAFYAFPSCAGLIGRKTPDGTVIETDEDFVRAACEASGVLVLPGSAFGMSPFVRVSFAVEETLLKTALGRLADFCRTLR